jgi:hypothetical protein
VVGEDDEVARFQQVAEMLHSLVDIQQLAVLCAVFLPGRAEFLGEESEGLPSIPDALLQHSIHGGRGGVCGECKWRGSIRMRQ